MILDILEEQLSTPTTKCVVGRWVVSLTTEEQNGLEKIKELPKYNLVNLYRKLNERTELPFKLTSFKSHMRGVCTCQ